MVTIIAAVIPVGLEMERTVLTLMNAQLIHIIVIPMLLASMIMDHLAVHVKLAIQGWVLFAKT